MNWKKLTIKPFVYGIMFGLGCYAGSLIIRSSLVSDLLADAKVNALKKV
jgi:hypothetical protein